MVKENLHPKQELGAAIAISGLMVQHPKSHILNRNSQRKVHKPEGQAKRMSIISVFNDFHGPRSPDWQKPGLGLAVGLNQGGLPDKLTTSQTLR